MAEKRTRVVIDTNVLVGYMFSSLAQRLPQHLRPYNEQYERDGKVVAFCLRHYQLVGSEQTIAEFTRIAMSVSSNRALPAPGSALRAQHVEQMVDRMLRFEPDPNRRSARRSRDKDDQMFVNLAAKAKAPWVISNDRHLTNLPRLGNRVFLSPERFMASVMAAEEYAACLTYRVKGLSDARL